MSNALPDIHALWIGTNLGEISRCCLKSFVAQGHKVFLHAYSEINDVPNEVQVSDANLIIPKEKIFKHKKTGSYALFSDLFRYELLKQIDGGIYVDCDVYCIRPITLDSNDYILGFESDQKVNGAVLAIPKHSQLLENLLNASYNPHFIPPWYRKSRRIRFKLKKFLGIATHITEMPWGVIGPEAITYFVKQLNLTNKLQPIDYFYPVHYECIGQLLEKDLAIEDIITHRTLCVHLYNEILRKVDLATIDSECILAKMLRNQI